jgi:hypothetical protein
MYQPSRAPEDNTVTRWIANELMKLSRDQFEASNSQLFEPLYAAPSRIYPCMVVYADGAAWNPGSGEGIYRRNLANNAWVFVG